MILFSKETLQFLHDCDITNNKEISTSLQFSMLNEIVINQKKTNLYYSTVFTLFILFGFFIFNEKFEIIIFIITGFISTLYSTTQFLLLRKAKKSINKTNKENIHNIFFKNLTNKYNNNTDFEKITRDIFNNYLLSSEEIDYIYSKYKKSNLKKPDIEKVYNTLLTAKLKSTPLPSTTISLNEHRVETLN